MILLHPESVQGASVPCNDTIWRSQEYQDCTTCQRRHTCFPQAAPNSFGGCQAPQQGWSAGHLRMARSSAEGALAVVLGQPLSVVQRRLAAHVVLQDRGKLLLLMQESLCKPGKTVGRKKLARPRSFARRPLKGWRVNDADVKRQQGHCAFTLHAPLKAEVLRHS